MKTKKLKTIGIVAIATFILSISGKVSDAQSYLTVYMDSVQLYDTISVCGAYDSIKLAPLKDITEYLFWIAVKNNSIYSEDWDTIYTDTLHLPRDFSGLIGCQGYGGNDCCGNWIYINSLSLVAENKTVTCGDTAYLIASTNYAGKSDAEYNWSPATGLSDPTLSNPKAFVTDNVEYTVTITTPGGCTASTNASVSLRPMDSPVICLVSVDSTDKNVIYWEKPVSAGIDSFNIYKETNVTNVYQKIGSIGYNENGIFVDTLSKPKIQSNKYKLSIIDICGFESDKSVPHKTMHLSINQGFNNVWNLIWEPYEGVTVSTYYIYRGVNKKDLELIGTTSASNTQYSDLSAPAGNVYYQIEIVSPVECNIPDNGLKSTSETIGTSRSNMVSYTQTGIAESTFKPTRLYVYPIPAKEILYIQSNATGYLKSENESQYLKSENKIYVLEGYLRICDLTGKIVKDLQFKSSKPEIDISDLTSGFYIIKIETEDITSVQRFIKN